MTRSALSRHQADAAETITFTVPLPPRELRTNSRTRVVGYKARLVREYAEAVWCAAHECTITKPWPEFNGTFTSRAVLLHTTEAAAKRIDTLGFPWERVSLVLTWRHHRQAPDKDNIVHNAKHLIDVLHARGARPLGIFRDDSPDCLVSIEVETEKVSRKEDEAIVVEVRRR